MARYALTILLSAFLLFQVQPLIAKYILPWFGGGPGIWTTCMLFFQMVLLIGYAYAHLIAARMPARRQALVHAGLVLVSLLFLPIIPSEAWKPTGAGIPVLRILGLLGLAIGVPYLVVSTTSPLLQRWFSLTSPGRSPYRLYSLSNVGSLLALLGYPIIFEPWLTLETQAISWSIGYGIFAVLVLYTAWRLYQQAPVEAVEEAVAESPPPDEGAPDGQDASEPHGEHRPRTSDWLLWLGLTAFPSMMLLAVTNQLCQEVAVIPFLWVLPLSLYIISFIICFDNERWYKRAVFAPLLMLSGAGTAICMYEPFVTPMGVQIPTYSLCLFSCCMVCHGELARTKPAPKYLTSFFLAVAAGGALGGAFVVAIAPMLFYGYWELNLAMAGCAGLPLVVFFRTRPEWEGPKSKSTLLLGLYMLGLAGILSAMVFEPFTVEDDVIDRSRSFYGVVRVLERKDRIGVYRSLRHGRIQHGFQYMDDANRMMKSSYYAPNSGVGIAIEDHPRRDAGLPMRIGIIGLGTGTVAVYGEPGDTVRFYEINPDVKRLAEEHFTHMSESPATVDVVLGDARVQMEHQLARGEPQEFDVLVLDAFSSDAIPMHLMTKESFELYAKQMKPDGILAVHITNRYLRLGPVVLGIAEALGYRPLWFDFNAGKDPTLSSCDWLVLTHNQEFLERAKKRNKHEDWPKPDSERIVWTDDYGSLVHVLK